MAEALVGRSLRVAPGNRRMRDEIARADPSMTLRSLAMPGLMPEEALKQIGRITE
jgi:hypothetical protein